MKHLISTIQLAVWDLFHSQRPCEMMTLREVGRILPETARLAYSSQLKAIKCIQRHSYGREVNLYLHSPNDCRKILEFNCKKEAHLATVRLRAGTQLFEAKVFAVGGRVFQIIFGVRQPSPAAALEVLESQLHIDPMTGFESITTPCPRIDEFLNFPDEYFEILKTQRRKFNDWYFLDMTQIRQVIVGDMDWYVIAENLEKGVICLKKKCDKMFFLSFDGTAPAEVKVPLLQFIEAT